MQVSITRAAILTAVKEQIIRTDKDDEVYRRTQYICNDIADDFKGFRGLKERTTAVTLTQNTSYVDISTELANLYGSRIRSVSLIDTGNSDNNRDLNEISYEEYLMWLEDPANPDSEHYGDPIWYAIEGDYLYFKYVPDLTTYTVKINFGKIHPTISGSVDISYPADFEECIVEGVLWKYYDSVEHNDQKSQKHHQNYEVLKRKKILSYKNKPNQQDTVSCNW